MKRFITNFHKHKKRSELKLKLMKSIKIWIPSFFLAHLFSSLLRSCWWTGFFLPRDLLNFANWNFFVSLLNEILIFFYYCPLQQTHSKRAKKHLICVSRSMRCWWWWGAEQRGDREKTGNNEKDGKVTAAV